MYWKKPYLLLERNVREGTVLNTGKECTGRDRIYYWKVMYEMETYLQLETNVREGTVFTIGK